MTYRIGYRSLRGREAAPLAVDESMGSRCCHNGIPTAKMEGANNY
jgi:hypothetical protein